jgi:hypothetical protein
MLRPSQMILRDGTMLTAIRENRSQTDIFLRHHLCGGGIPRPVMLRCLLPLGTADRPTDRAEVGTAIRRDCFQRVGAGYI